MNHQTLARRLVWEASFSTCRQRRTTGRLLKGRSFIRTASAQTSHRLVSCFAAPKMSPPKHIPASLHTPNIAHPCLQDLSHLMGLQERNEWPEDQCLLSLGNENVIPKQGCSVSASEIPWNSGSTLRPGCVPVEP